MESCRSLRESATMCWSFFCTSERNCCSVIFIPYFSALCIRSLCSSCFADSSIFFASAWGVDCRAAMRAAEVNTLSFNFASKGLSFLGIPRGM